MRMGRGCVYLLAIMAFAAGLVMAAGPVRAQNQDPPAKLYLTPGAESTAHPLFLQRLFGSSGSRSGLGPGKPYDFSAQGIVRQQTQDWRELADKFNADSKAKLDAVRAEREKAMDDMYAQDNIMLAQAEVKKRQAEAQVQARMAEIARQQRAQLVSSTPAQRRTSRGSRRAGSTRSVNSYKPPVYYNGQQQQNAHPPIFLH